MNKVVIFADSTCDLSEELINKYDIKIAPLHVVFEDKVYEDGINIHPMELYKMVEEKGVLPKTSGCSQIEYENYFKKYLDEGCDIVFTGISSQMSGTFQNVVLLSQKYPDRLYPVDSGNLSTGIGLLVIKACEYRDQGLSAKEIKEKFEELVPHVKTQFVIKKLDYLYKGGRCTSMSRVFGTLLRIHPMIVVRDGRMVVGKKIIGKMEKSVKVMTDIFLKDFDQIDLNHVFITDSSMADDLYDLIIKQLTEAGVINKIKNLYHTHAGCVVSSHCGPSTIGILYIMKKDLNDDSLDEDAFK